MTPEVQLWKVPAGAEILAVPKELEAPRNQIIHMCAHLMKLYGIKRVSCNVSMVGPCGVTSPEFELMPAFESLRPMAFKATEVTAVRAIMPLMMAYGILGMTILLDDKDKQDMLRMWNTMKTPMPSTVLPAPIIPGEGHEA